MVIKAQNTLNKIVVSIYFNTSRVSLAKTPVNWYQFSESLKYLTNLKISLKTNVQIEEAVLNVITPIQTVIYNAL